MRNALIRFLCDHAEQYNLYLIVADLGYSVIEPFASRFPSRFLNVGVAEQSMASIASGMASEGARCFCYSIANFPTFRCAEQIRNDIDYHNFPVCIVSVGGGLAYGSMGYSHHAIQDYGLMRLFPRMTIYAPADPSQAISCLSHIVASESPAYLRLHKAGEPCLYGESTGPVRPGKLVYLCGSRSSKTCILTTGYPAQHLYSLYSLSLNVGVYTVPAWGDMYRQDLVDDLANFSDIHCVEDHLVSGGFGSWVLESLSSSHQVSRIKLHCLPSSIINHVGQEEYLLRTSAIFNDLPTP